MVLRGQDGWRRHPIFKWGLTDAIPGLREGAAAFGVFLAIDFARQKLYPDAHHHHSGSEHGSGHTDGHAAGTVAAPAHAPAHGAGH